LVVNGLICNCLCFHFRFTLIISMVGVFYLSSSAAL